MSPGRAPNRTDSLLADEKARQLAASCTPKGRRAAKGQRRSKLQVLKFGGTSVGRASRLDDLTQIVVRARQQGPVLVVVSALAGVTNELHSALDAACRGEPSIGLERQLLRQHLEDPANRLGREARDSLEAEIQPRLRELEQLLDGVRLLGEVPRGVRHRVLATGERLSAPRVAAWLRAAEAPACVVDGSEVIRVRDDGAEPEVDIRATRHRVIEGLGGLFQGQVPVVTGFLGADEKGRTITLGRGASDLSATVLAAALDVDTVEIWTDTDGVFTADPRRVSAARPLRQLGYEETAALARYGARVLHPRTLLPVARTGIPVHVRSTLEPAEPGTRISTETPPRPEPEDPGSTPLGIRSASAAENRERPDPEPNIARAITTVRAVRLDLFATSGVRLSSRTFETLERLQVDPLSVRQSGERMSLLVRALDADPLEEEVRREFRHVTVTFARRDGLAAVAVLPGNADGPTVLAKIPQILSQRGVALLDLFLDPAAADNGVECHLAVGVVQEGLADLALKALHSSLVAVSESVDSPAFEHGLGEGLARDGLAIAGARNTDSPTLRDTALRNTPMGAVSSG